MKQQLLSWKHMPVRIMINTLPESDMAKSVRLGYQAMKQQSTGALICLVDHPLVQPETVKHMSRLGPEVLPTGSSFPPFRNGAAIPPCSPGPCWRKSIKVLTSGRSSGGIPIR